MRFRTFLTRMHKYYDIRTLEADTYGYFKEWMKGLSVDELVALVEKWERDK